MEFYTKALQGLTSEFERLPGIGRKTAERLAYHVLRSPSEDAMKLAYAIRDVKKNVRFCRRCFNLSEADDCALCLDESRDRSKICIVEQPKDLLAIEAAGTYKGLYHVLLGSFAPLDGVAPQDLTLKGLVDRLRAGGVREVILATNPTFEGEGTALLIAEKLKPFKEVVLTRIARGIPSGSQLEHASKNIVADALEGRREMDS